MELQEHIFTSDAEFDQIYSDKIRKLSSTHWTTIDVARMAVEWLDLDINSHVLDIGAGVGKFCAIAGEIAPCKITGVEKRSNLVRIAKKVIKEKGLNNVRIIHSNITQIDFSNFNAFYYYNPFCEQISIHNLIDETIQYSPEKYRMYEDYVLDELEKMPIETRIVTYCSREFALPASYELRNLFFNGNLALWVKNK